MKNKIFLLVIISLFIINQSQAQGKKRAKKIILKGLVIDTENNPVKNASVFIDGKNSKVLSDDEGLFKIKVKSDVKTITIFTLEQGAKEVAYDGESEMTFTLEATSESVEDELNATYKEESKIINNNYIKEHKRNLAANSNKINKNTINNADHYLTIYEMIQGEVAGVMVSGSTIRIRGVGTLTGNTTPLFIVNGMPVSSLDHISPSQVESISVLKDSSAAIYGVRGANGVIVITLKKLIQE